MEERHLVAPAGGRIIEVDVPDFSRPDIQVRDCADIGQVGRSSEAEAGNLFHASVADIDEGSAGGRVRQPVTVAVMVDDGELSAPFVVALAQGELIDFRPVLILGEAQLERARVEILVDASAVEPAFPQPSVQVQVELLPAEMVGIVVQRAVEGFLSVESQLGERVDGIADVTGRDGCLGYLHQSDMREAAVAAPMRVYVMGIRIIDDRKAVLEYVDISAGQADRDLAGTISTCCVQHDVTAVRLPLLFATGRDRILYSFLCIKSRCKETAGKGRDKIPFHGNSFHIDCFKMFSRQCVLRRQK